MNFFSKYKFKSVFFQMVLILITFSLLSIIIYSSFSFKLITRGIQEKNNIMYVNILNNAKNALDYSFENLHSIITHTAKEKSVISAVVSPNSADNSSNDLEVLNVLSTLREENEIINDVYFYVPKNQKVYTSRFEIVNRGQFNKNDILEYYLSKPSEGNNIEIGGRVTNIISHDNKIYLIRDFPLEGDKRLGIIIVKIEPDKLYHILQGQGVNYANNLLVYDTDNNPLFPDSIKYGSLENSFIKTITDKKDGMDLIANKRYFYAVSPISQFKFMYILNETSFFPKISQTFSAVLPLGFSIILICLLLALFLTNRVYSPIKRLVSNVQNVSSQNNFQYSGNEFDYLRGTFFNVINRSNNMDRVIKDIIPDISRKLFDDLLEGKPMETSYIQSTLENIESTLDTLGVYNVMVMKIDENSTKDELDLFLITVHRILKEKSVKTGRYHAQMMDKGLFVVIFEFDKSLSELSLKLFINDISKSILSNCANLHLSAALDKGKTYHSIQEVQFSYEEAIKGLDGNKRIDDATKPENNDDEEDSSAFPSHVNYNKEYFNARVAKINDLVVNNDKAGALILAKQISKTIAESNNEVETIRVIYNTFIEAILLKMLNFNINNNSGDFLNRFQNEDVLNTSCDLKEMQAYVEDFCEQVLALAADYYKKQQHKYIIAAKKYIEKNYSDPSLSLSSVADYVNTNTSYLSKLFKNNLDVNFNDYLNSYRIEKAKALLDSSNMTLKEVATATGFNSQQNFIRVFKKFQGVTPGRYYE